MKRLLALMITALLVASSSHVAAQGASDIALKKPSTARMDLVDALVARKSTRAFAERPLATDDLGAICGPPTVSIAREESAPRRPRMEGSISNSIVSEKAPGSMTRTA